jgi:hypothetical protein
VHASALVAFAVEVMCVIKQTPCRYAVRIFSPAA